MYLLVTLQHAQRAENGNSFLVLDRILVLIVVQGYGGSADSQQADHHDKNESQAQGSLESSHNETPPLSSTPFGAHNMYQRLMIRNSEADHQTAIPALTWDARRSERR